MTTDNIVYGDMDVDTPRDGKAKAQTLVGMDEVSNYLTGDAFAIMGGRGGNDVLTGGAGSSDNAFVGDANRMADDSEGGNDVLTGSAEADNNFLYGDALVMTNSRGGNDVLTGGADADNNVLYGDAQFHESGSAVICGNDTLISGTGNDVMWGDIASSIDNGSSVDLDLDEVTTGHDVFVFYAKNGQDTIHDFRRGEDMIALRDVGFASFSALQEIISETATGTVIQFDDDNTITVIGVTGLMAGDFSWS